MSDETWRKGTTHDRSGPNGVYLQAKAELLERLAAKKRERQKPQPPREKP